MCVLSAVMIGCTQTNNEDDMSYFSELEKAGHVTYDEDGCVFADPTPPDTTESYTVEAEFDRYIDVINKYFSIENRYAPIEETRNYLNKVADYSELSDSDEKFENLYYMEGNTYSYNDYSNETTGTKMIAGENHIINCYATISEDDIATIHYLSVGNTNMLAGGEVLIDDGYVTEDMLRTIRGSDITWNVV